jgi:hypothetical protein
LGPAGAWDRQLTAEYIKKPLRSPDGSKLGR